VPQTRWALLQAGLRSRAVLTPWDADLNPSTWTRGHRSAAEHTKISYLCNLERRSLSPNAQPHLPQPNLPMEPLPRSTRRAPHPQHAIKAARRSSCRVAHRSVRPNTVSENPTMSAPPSDVRTNPQQRVAPQSFERWRRRASCTDTLARCWSNALRC